MATRIIENLIIDEDPHTVNNWLERLECAIDIAIFNSSDKLPTDAAERTAKEGSMKRTYLLSNLGPSSYKLLKSYCTPTAPTAKTYEELKTILREKLSPGTNVISEQYRFNQLKQGVTESLAVYMARVKEHATMCEFGQQYDMMVRNRFITGLRSERIRTSLLSDCKNDTTADQVYGKAVIKQQAAQSNIAMNSVNHVKFGASNNQHRSNSSNRGNFRGNCRGCLCH